MVNNKAYRKKHIVVFGGARGIGKTVAEMFAAVGADVTIVSRSAVDVAAAVEELGVQGDVADITDVGAVERVFAAAAPVDAVINTAAIQGGAGAIGPIWSTELSAVRQVIDINLFGSFVILRTALAHMREIGNGVVILFSGGGAAGPRPGVDAYGAAKTGVLRLVESAQAALDEEDSQVRVFAVAPGAVATAMIRELIDNAVVVPGEADVANRIVAGEDGVPSTMAADLCQFLMLPEARPLAGRLVHVKETYRDYTERDLTPDDGRLRRVDYASRS